MALMTRDDYIESLRAMNKRVFIMGQEVEDLVDHPLVRPSLNACAMTYELAQLPEHAGLAQATSNLTGEKVNRFTHLHQDASDLVTKVKMQRRLGQMTGCCFQRCVGMDAHQRTRFGDLRDGPGIGDRVSCRVPPLPAVRAGARPGGRRRDDGPQGRPQVEPLAAGRPGPVRAHRR